MTTGQRTVMLAVSREGGRHVQCESECPADDGTDAGAPVLKWGAAAVAAAGLVAVYGVYGDAHPKADQKAGLPFVLMLAVIAAVVVFGVVVPRALRSRRATSARPGAAGLVLSILGLVLAPVAFWSGIPLVLGAGGSLLGSEGRRSARARGASATRESAAITVGVLAIVATLAIVVLGNTLLSS